MGGRKGRKPRECEDVTKESKSKRRDEDIEIRWRLEGGCGKEGTSSFRFEGSLLWRFKINIYILTQISLFLQNDMKRATCVSLRNQHPFYSQPFWFDTFMNSTNFNRRPAKFKNIKRKACLRYFPHPFPLVNTEPSFMAEWLVDPFPPRYSQPFRNLASEWKFRCEF